MRYSWLLRLTKNVVGDCFMLLTCMNVYHLL